MKPKPYYQQVPLSHDEKELLTTIARTRIKYASVFYLFMVGLVATKAYDTSNNFFGHSVREQDGTVIWQANEDSKSVSKTLMSWIGFSVLGIPVIGAGFFYYLKKIRPFAMDAKTGMKERVPYLIERKQYFDHTGQYYFALNDPNYMHHEVDEAFYNGLQVGDALYVYRAQLSGYTFNERGSFSL